MGAWRKHGAPVVSRPSTVASWRCASSATADARISKIPKSRVIVSGRRLGDGALSPLGWLFA